MIKEEFLKQAKAKISNKPIDRVSDCVKELLKKNDLVIDAHAHIFDENSVPAPYLQIRFFDWLEKITGTVAFEELIEKLIENKFAYRLIHIKKIIPNSRTKILGFYKKHVAKNLGTVINTTLMVDLGIGWKNSIEKNTKHKIKLIHEQIKEVKTLLYENEPILPFFAIEPRRATNEVSDPQLEEKERCLYDNFLDAFTGEQKFFGIKLYPAMGFLPFDERLKPIFKICEEKNIPVITHCGGNIICTTNKNNANFKNEIKEYIALEKPKKFDFKKYGNRAGFFNHPMHWEPVLKEFPNLRLDLGHFGGGKNWKNEYKGKKTVRIDKIESLMLKYDNVYSDFSYNISKKKLSKALRSRLEKTPVFLERTMFGTDFWMVEPASLGALNKKILNFKEINKQNWLQFSRTNPLKFFGLEQKEQGELII